MLFLSEIMLQVKWQKVLSICSPGEVLLEHTQVIKLLKMISQTFEAGAAIPKNCKRENVMEHEYPNTPKGDWAGLFLTLKINCCAG